ncbi:hypothetical protein METBISCDRAFT_28314 [Metschnikowia bicuspidata]|uniref:DUF3020 domain-containing protein n=1 Tax=Metschnikowia bicuspidata TaxID=27322 RepID=A0A4P9Z9B9_9ASCO|nr:hypothetical protein METBISCDRAFT_28314 [Metschnikowia bicuspidata]
MHQNHRHGEPLLDKPAVYNERPLYFDSENHGDLESAIGAALGLLGFVTGPTESADAKNTNDESVAQLESVVGSNSDAPSALVVVKLDLSLNRTSDGNGGTNTNESWAPVAGQNQIHSGEASNEVGGADTRSAAAQRDDVGIDEYALKLATELVKKAQEGQVDEEDDGDARDAGDTREDAVEGHGRQLEEGHALQKETQAHGQQVPDDTNVDLESTISDMFKNLSGSSLLGGQEKTVEAEVPPEPEEGPAESSTRKTNDTEHPGNSEHSGSAHADPAIHNPDGSFEAEVNLEDVIGQAFKAIIEPSYQSQTNGKLEPGKDSSGRVNVPEQAIQRNDQGLAVDDQGDNYHKRPARENLDDVALDLEGSFQNVARQMVRGHGPGQESSTYRNACSTSPPLTKKEQRAIPTLDENVLEHFQLNSEQEDPIEPSFKYTEPGSSATAKNSAPHNAAKESELYKLQMNEILQNAFNMAMLNPQELLGEDTGASEAKTSGKPTTTAELASLAADSGVNNGSEAASSGKPLSIAETLALHRSNMASENREVLNFQSLKESLKNNNSTPMYPELSNILSSLSLHIQSGTSQDLMSVIRQMTNSLMLNKNFSLNVNTAVLKLLMEVNNLPEDKAFLVESLKKTQRFLSLRAGGEESEKAQTLICNVLTILNPKPLDSDATSANTEYVSPQVSAFFDQAYSTLASFSSSRLRNILLGEKPDTDSVEYKERVRIENRERKKKWRQENTERNKDNDLRSRVIKRANSMFGSGTLPERRAWIEEEFTRRREKRISRQKQGGAKPESPGPALNDGKPRSDTMANDSKLVQRVTDIFNLVAECGTERDPKAVMVAVSAAIAVATSSLTDKNDLGDPKPAKSDMSLIISSILENSAKSGSLKHIQFLSKNPKQPSVVNYGFLKLSSLNGVGNALKLSNSAVSADSLKGPTNRYENELHPPEYKRPRTEMLPAMSGGFLSLPVSSTLWNSVSGLKMPQYGKQTPNKPKSHECIRNFSQTLPSVSPFLSNKSGLDQKPGLTGELKRPGSFQNPMKSAERAGKPFAFPTFYSSRTT